MADLYDWDNMTKAEISAAIDKIFSEYEEADAQVWGDHDDRAYAEDFDRITPNLVVGAEVFAWRGMGVWSLDMIQRLRAAGVTHVIDCRAEADEAQVLRLWAQHAPEIQVFYAGTGDDGKPKGRAFFGKAVRWATEALRTNSEAVIYAHCAAGINRGPSMGAAILMAQGKSCAEAERLIRKARPKVWLAYLKDADRYVRAAGLRKSA